MKDKIYLVLRTFDYEGSEVIQAFYSYTMALAYIDNAKAYLKEDYYYYSYELKEMEIA